MKQKTAVITKCLHYYNLLIMTSVTTTFSEHVTWCWVVLSENLQR